MEWISVKKYRPAPSAKDTTCTNALFFIDRYGTPYVGWYYPAKNEWRCDETVYADHDNIVEDVTYFCIPAPLGIEEE